MIKGDAAGEIAAPARRPLDRGGPRGAMPTASRRSSRATSKALRENVVARRAYSPADLEAMNINLVGGDPYGGSCTIDQSFIWRPFANTRNHETPIRGPLPDRRLDPSRRRAFRRLGIRAGGAARMNRPEPLRSSPQLRSSRGESGRIPTLGEIGLDHFAPYLLNRIVARWNADLAAELKEHDLNTIQMRTLAVLSLMSGATVNELSVYTVTEQSTMSRALDGMERDGLSGATSRRRHAGARGACHGRGARGIPSLLAEMHAAFANMFAGIVGG